MSTIADLLEGKRVCICGGSGGVGKTTTSAAIAMGMAARGLKVAVVTIDPARRLAGSLGLDELGNEPRLVEADRFLAHGLEMKGELWAMMLDPKRTFDDLIERLAPDERARDEVLQNRIYQELSSAVAGSQEFTAIAKLYELDRDGGFDLLVLDTPPSRNALDFLDAPDRLSGFLEGRALQAFLRPTGLGMRIVGRGTGVVFSVLGRVTGVDLVQDLSVFFRAVGGMIDGFKERAARVGALLADPATTFLLVTSPEREPIDEALFFWRKLEAARMPFGGVIVNKVHPGRPASPESDAEDLGPVISGELSELLGDKLAVKVAESHREHQVLARRDVANIARLIHGMGTPPMIEIAELDDDVHDVEGLLRVHAFLFATERERARLTAQA